MTKSQLQRQVRSLARTQLFDDSGVDPAGVALYTLSDPRDIRLPRYIGQTNLPPRRFQQHLSTARLWLPDEIPWWVKSPKLRPLYDWIRSLHRDGGRLPVMVIQTWVPTLEEARLIERERIYDGLKARLPLLNVESEILSRQIPLL